MLSLSDLGLDKEDVATSDIKKAANMVMDNIFALWEAERNAD